jgi:Transglutaminase-like superfamily
MGTVRPRWQQLACLSEEELARQDVAVLNLATAEGLPGGPTPRQERECIDRLDHYARTVAQYTAQRMPDFEKVAERYEHSEAKFRVVLMVSMLQKVHGVRYNPAKIAPDTIHTAADSFVHGPLVGEGGTCASLPVVYAAVGRRLGYPIRLVGCKQHLFCRWESPLDRFNIEVNGTGTDDPPDSVYREGRYHCDPDEERFHRFLITRTASEEFADFVTQRAYQWIDEGDFRRGLEAFAWACKLAPLHKSYEWHLVQYLDRWAARLNALLPPNFPTLFIESIPGWRHPWLPSPVERQIIKCETVERVLNAPHHAAWWEELRRSPNARPRSVPVEIHLRVMA